MTRVTPPLQTAPSSDFIRAQIENTLRFYTQACKNLGSDPLPQSLLSDGSRGADQHRHLVSSTRYLLNFARAHRLDGREQWRELAAQAHLELERDFLWQPEGPVSCAWAWQVNADGSRDLSVQMYGLAFVIAAQARALQLALPGARKRLDDACGLAERLFWQGEHGLYADEGRWQGSNFVLDDYRGQNANMHACEAHLVAYEATGERHQLERATTIARRLCIDLADDGDICEHFDLQWKPDWNYNIHDRQHLYRPWGLQIGHQIEWAKLLVFIARASGEPWPWDLAARACLRAFERGWDVEFGGLVYGIDREDRWCDDRKHFWVQAEALSTTALLAQGTHDHDPKFHDLYLQTWNYVLEHFVDAEHGAWHRIASRDHSQFDGYKARPGAKVDYHNLGACFDILEFVQPDSPSAG